MKKKIHIALLLGIFVLVYATWYRMFRGPDGTLTTGGFHSLKYFTVQSNLLVGIGALVLAVQEIQELKGTREKVSKGAEMLFYAGTVAVALTFLVTALFLSRIFGIAVLYSGVSFWFHLIVPLLAFAVFCFFPHPYRFTVRDSLTVLGPVLLYGVYYAGMIVKYGLDDPRTDWYYFGFAGIRGIPAVLAALVLITWIIALLFRKAGSRR